MSTRTRLMYTLAGALLVNSAPHFVIGLTGRRNPTAFGRNSSPLVNILWGAINFFGAVALVMRADTQEGALRDPAGWALPVTTGGLVWSTFMFLFELRKHLSRGGNLKSA